MCRRADTGRCSREPGAARATGASGGSAAPPLPTPDVGLRVPGAQRANVGRVRWPGLWRAVTLAAGMSQLPWQAFTRHTALNSDPWLPAPTRRLPSQALRVVVCALSPRARTHCTLGTALGEEPEGKCQRFTSGRRRRLSTAPIQRQQGGRGALGPRVGGQRE